MITASNVAHLWDRIPPVFLDLIEEVLSFVKKADPESRAFTEQGTKQDRRFLIGYHLCKNTFIVSRNDSNEIDGIALWHRFNEPWTWQQITQWRPDDERGKAIVVSHLVATSQKAREMLVNGIKSRVLDDDGIKVTALRKNRLVEFSLKNAERFSKLKFN